VAFLVGLVLLCACDREEEMMLLPPLFLGSMPWEQHIMGASAAAMPFLGSCCCRAVPGLALLPRRRSWARASATPSFLGSRCCRTVVPGLALLPHRCFWVRAAAALLFLGSRCYRTVVPGLR
jgi:hypothetical protein